MARRLAPSATGGLGVLQRVLALGRLPLGLQLPEGGCSCAREPIGSTPDPAHLPHRLPRVGRRSGTACVRVGRTRQRWQGAIAANAERDRQQVGPSDTSGRLPGHLACSISCVSLPVEEDGWRSSLARGRRALAPPGLGCVGGSGAKASRDASAMGCGTPRGALTGQEIRRRDQHLPPGAEDLRELSEDQKGPSATLIAHGDLSLERMPCRSASSTKIDVKDHRARIWS